MRDDTAVSFYNRLQGIRNIALDMQTRLKTEQKDSQLSDMLFHASLGDIADLCKTLQSRLTWAPVEPKIGDRIL